MRAVIPVAGVGTRLRPHTHTVPKVLLHVAGKPILGHILDELIAQDIRQYTIVVGYKREAVERYVREHYTDIDVQFVWQKERRGLGHSIWVARETFDSGPLLIILGDTIFDVNLAPVLHMPNSALGVKAVEDPRRFGVVHTDAQGVIEKLVEKPSKPESNLALVGLYVVRNAALLAASLSDLIERDIRTRGEYQLTDALQLMIDAGETFTTFPVEGWFDCGKPETLLATNRYLLEQQSGTSGSFGNSLIVQPSFVAPDAHIEHSVIGPYASIGAGAVIRNSVIRNSILGEQTVAEQAVLNASILANNSAIYGSFQELNVGDSSEIRLAR